jgi:hypothetical protein
MHQQLLASLPPSCRHHFPETHPYILQAAKGIRSIKMAKTEEPDDIKKILGPNEKVELYIKDKIYHPKLNIDSVVVTNERIILRHPHAAGLKKDYTDISYSDVEGVELDKKITRATLRLKNKKSKEAMELGNLPAEHAEQAYGIIRENVGRFQAPLSTGYANAPKKPKDPTDTK